MNAVSTLALVAILAVPGDPTRGAPAAAAEDTILLQFVSQGCVHCQTMQPIVAQLAQQGAKVQVVDVNQEPAAARQFNVTGVPTCIALRGGREVGRVAGVTSQEKLAALVQTVSPSPQAPPPSPLSPEQTARAATVRIKVEDPTGYGFGTGTIIDTHDNEALVITCGHLFRESKGKGKITADLFAAGAAQTGTAQTVDGQLIAYDLDRDVALISLRASGGVRPVTVAPPGCVVRPGDRVFSIGCDKGADPTLRTTHITAVNKYQGKPNFTAAGQPVDGRSGGGLFTAEGYLIGICNAADPADDEGLYAGLASIHGQLDQIGQAEIYQRAARVAAAASPPRDAGATTGLPSGAGTGGQATRGTNSAALASAQSGLPSALPVPQLPQTMPGAGRETAGSPYREANASRSPDIPGDLAPVAVVGEDTEIVFIVRSKRNPAQQSEVYVVDQAPPDLIARISHAARTSGEQRAALARASQSAARTATATPRPGLPPIVRGQSTEY